ncbi:hypothetical protein [Sphingopyxis witflariensis]|uniref:Uncharacterized protein n=1 Tax=Sphingopyxis witflariensis TaxID=173675 RepID=A0A246JNE5_9SPHN|nr:hypothetical protein [Sphingopyxis witflariensis]OWQ94174.1 hypothetical protein CDQ91_16175 [Sphingopyxis witflariensis]
MMCRIWGAVPAAAALAFAPLASDAQLLIVPGCGAGARMLVLPQDPTAPDRGGGRDCAKACHAASDRRSKDQKKNCCI